MLTPLQAIEILDQFMPDTDDQICLEAWQTLKAAVLAQQSNNKQSTPCVTCGALVPLSTVSCMECINP